MERLYILKRNLTLIYTTPLRFVHRIYGKEKSVGAVSISLEMAYTQLFWTILVHHSNVMVQEGCGQLTRVLRSDILMVLL